MGTLTRELCESVEQGTLAPEVAAERIHEYIRKEVDFIAHADKFGLRENRCFNMTRERMDAAEEWSRTQAPPEIGRRMLNASRGMARAKEAESGGGTGAEDY